MKPSVHAIGQYSNTTEKLATRIAIHNYSTNPQSWFTWVGEHLTLIGDILEVGAGTGELWRHVDHSKARLTLTDFSSAMCTQLREVPGATVKQCDATTLPFEAASFDSVIANHMLYHLDDPDAALREFARVLRPGGQLTVSLFGRNHLEELQTLGSSIGCPLVVVDTARITVETGPDFLSRYFVDVSVVEFPGDLSIPSPEPVVAYFASLNNGPLTPEQEASVRKSAEAGIATEGGFRIRKHTALLTACRS